MQKEKTKTCPTCGTENNASTRFCEVCGRTLIEKPIIIYSNPSHAFVPNEPDIDETKEAHRTSIVGRRLSIFFALLLIICMILSWAVLLPWYLHKSTDQGKSPITVVNPLLPSGLGEIKAPNGETIGVNDGSFAPFDVWRNPHELALKQQAAHSLQNGDVSGAVALWKEAHDIDSSDAEALIYGENQRVREAGVPYFTVAIGVAFANHNDNSPQSQLQGIYVAQEEFNRGYSPFKLRILIANSGSEVYYTAAIAQQVVQVAKQDKTVVGIIGWSTSSRSLLSLSLLANAKLSQISPQASDDSLSGISPYFFRVVPPNKVQAQEAAQFAGTLNVKNPVVFLDPQDNYSQNLASDFEAQFVKDGFAMPHEETFTANKTKDFSSLIQDALNKYHPDAFYFTSNSKGDTALFQDALPTSGPFANLPVISGDAGYVTHPNSYNRWFFTSFAFADAWSLIVGRDTPAFFQDYSSAFNPDGLKPAGYYGFTRPDDTVMLSYDATQVLLKGIQIALSDRKTTLTTLTPQAVAAALTKITGAQAYQGVSGQIAFDANHDPINKAVVFLYTSADGHLQMKSYQGCFIKGCP